VAETSINMMQSWSTTLCRQRYNNKTIQ